MKLMRYQKQEDLSWQISQAVTGVDGAKRLDSFSFQQDEFKTWAEKNVVLLELIS